MTQVAEGVKTARSARDLSRKVGVELPICDQVYAIMYEGKEPTRRGRADDSGAEVRRLTGSGGEHEALDGAGACDVGGLWK
jgi:hypothetical protein